MALSIPALAIAATVTMGSYDWNTPNQAALHAEAQQILETQVYQYKDLNLYGQHDYGIFKRLPEIREGYKVQINGETFQVARTMTISATDTWILRRRITALFTCANDNKDRYFVILEPS